MTGDYSPFGGVRLPQWWYEPTVTWPWPEPITTGTAIPAVKASAWECPRCHQIWAYWVPKCDCKPVEGG